MRQFCKLGGLLLLLLKQKTFAYSFLYKNKMASLNYSARGEETLRIVDIIQSQVYGENPEALNFPRSLSETEAGPSSTGQRRYLWTDAFGIINYLSQVLLLQQKEQHLQQQEQLEEDRNRLQIEQDQVAIQIQRNLNAAKVSSFNSWCTL